MKKAIVLTLTTLTILGATAIGAFAAIGAEETTYPEAYAGMVIYEEAATSDFAAPGYPVDYAGMTIYAEDASSIMAAPGM